MPGVCGKDGSDDGRPLTAPKFISEADLDIGVTAFHYEPSDRALRV
jgi:hypothetical protein